MHPALEEAQLKLKDIRQALQIEQDHRYVDVQGRQKKFSQYMAATLRGFADLPLPRDRLGELDRLKQQYRQYAFMGMPQRMSLLEETRDFLRVFSRRAQMMDAAAEGIPPPSQHQRSMKTPVQFLPGVGPKVAAILSQLNILTVRDLLHHYPRRYLDYQTRAPIAGLSEGQDVTVIGRVSSISAHTTRQRGLSIVSMTVADETGSVMVNWFYNKISRAQLESHKGRFEKGMLVMLSGRTKWDRFKKRYAIDRPVVEVISHAGDEPEAGQADSLHAGRIVPVYALAEGLHLRTFRKLVHGALQDYAATLTDPMPEAILARQRLLPLTQAIRQIHFPESQAQYEEARQRLAFDELFMMQVRLATVRQQYRHVSQGQVFTRRPEGLLDRFIAQLPYKLTNAQQRVLAEIYADMATAMPMYRLLQGDVGAGKTVVAVLCMLMAVDNGCQAALMAPTEVLAEQHYKNMIRWLTPLGLKVGLFLGKAGARERREMQQGLFNGQIHVAVGTHALIQDEVQFHRLGMVVIDEQHRFGVRQRMLLKAKGEHPDLLTMTATPIPRTLAMTVHGDLDVSVLDELPPGRQPIKTILLANTQRQQVIQLLRLELQQGRQAYVVFPLIEESETLAAKAATSEYEQLQKIFTEHTVGLLHGKMKPQEKEAVMSRFADGDIRLLVSTTVIEVGVDVPNATVMVIENADRFGLAQLHQLRGRVGRGQHASYCVLVSDSSSEETRTRLGIMVRTQDGFEIAEEDLALRGPGEFLGTRQSGLPELQLADLITDAELLSAARDEAETVVSTPGYLHDHPALADALREQNEATLGLLGSG
ncbi:MAG: ATP-dependent DNA helicase RecG [Candidatus Melainabacteria bacterium]